APRYLPGVLRRALLWLLAAVLSVPATAVASCGDDPGDAAAVASTRAAVETDCDCASASSHGAYLRCVVQKVRTAVSSRELRRDCKGSVIRCAARSTCGRPGAVTCCGANASGDKSCKVKRHLAHCDAAHDGTACVSI